MKQIHFESGEISSQISDPDWNDGRVESVIATD